MSGPMYETLEDVMARCRRRAEEAQMELERLPCRARDDYDGIAACREAKAYVECRYRDESEQCPRSRVHQATVEFSSNLARAEVPTAIRELLVSVRNDRSLLKTTVAMRAVAALVKRQAFSYDGTDGSAHIRGTENMLVLAGPPGVGKTVAACYGIGKLSGRYTRGYLLSDRRARGEFHGVRCLVIDQLGRVQDNEGRARTATAVEELLDVRSAERVLTILAGNFYRKQFDEEFGAAVVSRLAGSGAWIECGGEDMRKGTP